MGDGAGTLQLLQSLSGTTLQALDASSRFVPRRLRVQKELGENCPGNLRMPAFGQDLGPEQAVVERLASARQILQLLFRCRPATASELEGQGPAEQQTPRPETMHGGVEMMPGLVAPVGRLESLRKLYHQGRRRILEP